VRLWSLHPQYLDGIGLVALWREGLLARAVLTKKTIAYSHHPQLERFLACRNPLPTLDNYLWIVCEEAALRGYHFDHTKLGPRRGRATLRITSGQLAYEWEHLKKKLRMRDQTRYKRMRGIITPLPHPIFKIIPGEVANWERVHK
jgi:hypothetical protein